MDLHLRGRAALITGASKGIGKAVAIRLAKEGCDVVLVSRRLSDLETCKKQIEAIADISVTVAPADLSKSEEVLRIAAEHPDIDILVNNAGAIGPGTLLDVSDAQWREWWDLKVFGYINASREYYRAMMGRGGGVIVNIIGSAANSLNPNYIVGATGNSALDAFTRSLGSRSYKDGIRVVGIHPGPVATERLVMMQAGGLESPDMPFDRAAKPDEIAAAVAFFASDKSAYTSGTVMTIDGGSTAAFG